MFKGRIFGKGSKHSEETKKKMSLSRKGKKMSLKTRIRMSQSHIGLQVGEKNPSWKGGVSSKRSLFIRSLEYKKWRKSVFERDNYTCQVCKNRTSERNKVTLNAHHIKSYAKFPELRVSLDNGQTLCVPCHKKTDSYCVNI